ncbi:DNA (cytosine-5)-methyltransferase 1 [Streptosporangium becharense]|uniref:DNA (cytosine-5-)-methyltransferase n=1 Tax=Streptosporangium becharense TaxID=1816182 RepID=A0A7W9MGH0_9ACTN|nr:DNA cytosine methyltransferase [Streptosporangium becharense]MBB2909146.1 DNA (cytosine-5)-methyltransferase 1 [Streptosporangium becharense]MBB5819835.1 DNA (cytosine-5)-methyltransferase 1 [Streptosporangium becharense]
MLTLMDWFCGAGGSSQGAHAVPGVRVTLAANHWARAIESHAANFPETDHYQGDIRTAPVERWPVADIFWASPECPQWSVARGKTRDFATSMQGELFGPEKDEEVERSRALMEEVPMYLRGVQDRGGLVLAGVVENVVDVRAWDQWDRWLGEIRKLGYRTRTIALNSMHAHGTRTPAAPQSRDRLYVAYWHTSLGRTPDWDKWLRPTAWCSGCEAWVSAIQVFKTFGADMGRYRQQYVYRCPNATCRSQEVEPHALPAAAAIDWSLPGQRIGDRTKPLADKTLARIQAGLKKYARPLMVPAGGTWRNDAAPVTDPMPTRTTRENDGVAIPPFITELRGGSNVRAITEPLTTVATSGGHHGLAVPPLLIPVEGRDGKEPSPATSPLRTQTARNETGLAWLPFVAELRGGGSVARPVTEALATVTASGNHHGLVAPAGLVMRNNTPRGDAGYLSTPVNEPFRSLTTAGHQSLITWETLLVPYYGNGHARQAAEPIGTLSTRDRYAVVNGLDDVLFRMLEPHEIGRAMAFGETYTVIGNKREKVRQYGNAVTPPVAELIVSALVEAITGTDLERAA